MPWVIQAHIVGAFLIVGIFPFTPTGSPARGTASLRLSPLSAGDLVLEPKETARPTDAMERSPTKEQLTTLVALRSRGERTMPANLTQWNVEDEQFWASQGKAIATPQPVDIHPQLAVRLRGVALLGHHHRTDA